MVDYPIIFETHYGDSENEGVTKCDAQINTRLLRKARKDVFMKGHWRFRVEDKHDNEDAPHFILDFGYCVDQPIDSFKQTATHLVVDYKDYYSRTADEILLNPGTVSVWAQRSYDNRQFPNGDPGIRDALREMTKEYFAAMEDVLKDFDIVHDYF